MKRRILTSVLALIMMVSLLLPQNIAYADEIKERNTENLLGSYYNLESLLRQVGDEYENYDKISFIVQINDEEIQKQYGISAPDFSEIKSEGLSSQLAYASIARQKLYSAMSLLGVDFEVRETYDTALTGVSLETTFADAKKIARLKIVKSLEFNRTILAPKLESQNAIFTRDTSSNLMIEANKAWKKNYSGKGQLIAVIDSGTDPNHEIFEGFDNTGSYIESASQLKAMISGTDISNGFYFNEKIPFGFNYAERNTKIKEESESSHGMHVAGIISANKGKKIEGVAPDAQLAIMRVFGGGLFGGGTTPEIYNKAIDDAVKLGVDTINMSLGATGTTDSRLEETTLAALKRAQEAGIVVAIAAGNDGFMGFGALKGPNPSNPNYGLINSPSVADISMSVASVDNTEIIEKGIKLRRGDTDLEKLIAFSPTDDKTIEPEYFSFIHVGYGYEENYPNNTGTNTFDGLIKTKSVVDTKEEKKKNTITETKLLVVEESEIEELATEEVVEETTVETTTEEVVEETTVEAITEEVAEETTVETTTEEVVEETTVETTTEKVVEEITVETTTEKVAEETTVETTTEEVVEETTVEAITEELAEKTTEIVSEELVIETFKEELVENFELDEEQESAKVETLTNEKSLVLAGKIALIKRGREEGNAGNAADGYFNFHDKIKIAQEHGAIAAIVYNDIAGEPNFQMSFDDGSDIDIPSFFINNADGQFLVDNPDLKVQISQEDLLIQNPEGNKLSSFSSWGITEEGNLKPDISGPGGKIYSSINNNKYKVMSGTSMATPHVCGGIAIVRQYVKNTFPDVTGEEQHKLIKNIMMSTATPYEYKDSKRHGSPRGQGAGLMSLDRATNADVVVLGTNDISSINLGNLNSELDSNVITVNASLKSYADEDRVYKYYGELNSDQVVEDYITLKPNAVALSGEKTIVVPAGETVDVSVSFSISDDKISALKASMQNGFFLEGYIFFKEQNKANKDINVPFVGFSKAWKDLDIIEEDIYSLLEKNERPMYYKFADLVEAPYTYLATRLVNKFAPLGEMPDSTFENPNFSKDKIAFSPNGDGRGDTAHFMGTFLRNFSAVKLEVYDKANTSSYPIYTVHSDFPGMKNFYSANPFGGPNMNQTRTNWEWNGEKSNGEDVAEGKYYMKITSYADGNVGGEQSIVLPILLDRTFPRLAKSSYDESTRTFRILKLIEEGSGIREKYVTIDGDKDKDGNPVKHYIADDGTFVLPEGKQLSDAILKISDYAYNLLELRLDRAIKDGTEHMLFVKPVLKSGYIAKDKFKVRVENESGEQVNPYNLEAGNYTIIISDVDEEYELVSDSRIPVTIAEGEFDKVVNVEFRRKGKGGLLVVVSNNTDAKFRLFVVNETSGEEFELAPFIPEGQENVSANQGSFQGYVSPGEYKIDVRNLDEDTYFAIGDKKITAVLNDPGTDFKQVTIKKINKRDYKIKLNRGSYQGKLNVVLIGEDYGRTRMDIPFEAVESEKTLKLPKFLPFEIFTNGYEDDSHGSYMVKHTFENGQGTAVINIQEGVVSDEIDIDKDILELYVTQGENLEEEKFVLESWEIFEEVLYRAQKIYKDKLATQDSVDAIAKELREAIDSLVPYNGGPTMSEWRQKIEEAKKIYSGLDDSYTKDSKEFLIAAIEGASTAYKTDEPKYRTRKYIEESIMMLDRAIANLTKKNGALDFSYLDVLIDKAKNILDNKDDYKEKGMADLERAYNTTLEDKEYGEITNKNEMDTYRLYLQKCINKIETNVDKTKLSKEIELSKNINLIEYELDCRKPYRRALRDARDVIKNKLASEEEVKAALEKLKDAKKKLVKIGEEIGSGDDDNNGNTGNGNGGNDDNVGDDSGSNGGGISIPTEPQEPSKELVEEEIVPEAVFASVNEEEGNIVFNNNVLVDTSASAWYADSVKYVLSNGLMKGTEATKFSPNKKMTRAMFVTVLYRLNGDVESGRSMEGVDFSDLANDKWYTDSIVWASENGIVEGYANGQFGVNDTITRGQLCTIMYRYAQKKGYKIKVTDNISKFSDVGEVSDYQRDAMNWIVGEGIIQGTGGNKLSPNANATRAQLAAVFKRFVETIASRY